MCRICTTLGLQKQILVSPLLCFKHELHVGGICFQTRQQKPRRRDVFAEGGRYDKLIESLTMPGTRQIERCLVGATIAVSKISRLLASGSGPQPASNRHRPAALATEAAPRRCEVYVVSYTPGLIEERILVARDLWRNKVSADLIYDGTTALPARRWKSAEILPDDFAKLGPDRIAATARKEGIKFLVIVKGSNAARDTLLKVKDLRTNHEREGVFRSSPFDGDIERARRFIVYRQDLSTFLHDKLGASAASAAVEPMAPASARALPSGEGLDGHLSMPAETLKKMKHKQKQIILDKAAEGVNEALTASSDVPLCRHKQPA